ncbi:nuclear transport factor 2 family protein [Saxibacter everestensis]|uniref:Nuclear transport factor 2 family protein n=1 Tax=Saxibacter everestensis TaxID=2909229 RepID=A0ABY8QY12_9MICO|nr:nuclear transport factor 2 family protein [Brevibacteriaceae bacterium ZFBP1038]
MPDLLDELLARETEVWEALRLGDMAADRALLTPGFLGVYESGFGSREDHVREVKDGPSIASYELSEPRVVRLTEHIALLSYRADYTGARDGVADAMYVSSLWERAGVDEPWLNSFSQDTTATPPAA